jgi:hypothetical protein
MFPVESDKILFRQDKRQEQKDKDNGGDAKGNISMHA